MIRELIAWFVGLEVFETVTGTVRFDGCPACEEATRGRRCWRSCDGDRNEAVSRLSLFSTLY